MEKLLWQNAWNARFVILGFTLGSLYLQQVTWRRTLLYQDVFGLDGNGGRMLKIITNLTDEEMARLKYVRRLYWHWQGTRQFGHGKDNISHEELADRGIKWEDKYVEYVKRPPHDKYL